MPRVLVTGATGMVGRHVIQRFRSEDWTVRALVRDTAKASDLIEHGVTLAAGDTLDTDSLVRAAAGCDVIVHAAAAITTNGGWEAFRRPNIEGTNNAIAAAAAAGARLVHVSSVAVYGGSSRYREGGARTDEDTPFAPLENDSFYARSKRESEARVLEAHRAGKIWATAVRPCVIYGRHDRQFVPRMVKVVRFRAMPLIAGGRNSLAVVHAANVADGIALAATSSVSGGRAWNLANDHDVTVRDFFVRGAEAIGISLHTPPIPLVVARTLFKGVCAVAPLVFGEAFNVALSASLDFLTRDNPFSSARARLELGWNPQVQPEDGVRDAFRWAADHA